MDATGDPSRSARNNKSGESHDGNMMMRRGGPVQEVQISIDSQSFVNLGQLMGSRHGSVPATANGESAPRNAIRGGMHVLEDLGASDLSRDSEGESLRDFDQIFHPGEAEHQGESGPPSDLSWSRGELYRRVDHGPDDHPDGDDNESLLPALPSRSSTPGTDFAPPSNRSSFPGATEVAGAAWAEEDFAETLGAVRLENAQDDGKSGIAAAGVAATMTSAAVVAQARRSLEVSTDYPGGAPNPTVCYSSDSWMHLPQNDDNNKAEGAKELENRSCTDVSVANGREQEESGIDPKQQRYYDAAAAAARARRAAADALAECGECFAHAVDRAAVLATPPLQQLARAMKERVEAGADACTRGQQAVIKAVDDVPQAPVRMWLGRIAGSLVLGAILGGTATYYAFPRSIRSRSFAASACAPGGSDTTSPWWSTGGLEDSGTGTTHGFGDRLNKALSAARAGEAAAQQDLLEEVRNILAATGQSGGISAEHILRQFNAKRFKEASKAWSAAEGNVAGSDPLDPLFFVPPSSPIYTSSTSPSPSHHQHGQQEQQEQQEPFIPHGAAPSTDCAGGATGSAFCSSDAGGGVGVGGRGGVDDFDLSRVYAARARIFGESGRQQYRRPCGGGWVC